MALAIRLNRLLAVPVLAAGALAAVPASAQETSLPGPCPVQDPGPAYPVPSYDFCAYPLPSPDRGVPPNIDVRSPRLASDTSRDPRFAITIRTRPGTARASVASYRLQIRDAAAGAAASRPHRVRVAQSKPTTFMFRGRPGRTYVIRARAIDRAGRTGPFDTSRTIVPFDDSRKATRGIRTSGRFSRPRVRGAYEGRLSRSARRGTRLGFRFRGDRLYVVGRVSRRGGKALVVLNRRRRIISFFAKRTRARKVVAVFRARRKGMNSARIVTLGRKGSRNSRGKLVEIDALGVRSRR